MFQKIDKSGLAKIIEWARKEGWNPGKYDLDCFYNTDPDGFRGYFVDGEMIGGGSIVSYGGAFGFMGLFIVQPEFRGKKFGTDLWYQRRDTLLSRLNPGATIGMDGVVPMQPFYTKGGFNLFFNDERQVRAGAPFELAAQISDIGAEDYDAIAAMDTECFGFSRPNFLKGWLHIPESFRFKYTVDGKLEGFAVLRKAEDGYRIGPLFANNAVVAEELYKACLNAAGSENVHLDITLANTAAKEMTDKYQTQFVFGCGRMYHGIPPVFPVEKVFGLTTFELG